MSMTCFKLWLFCTGAIGIFSCFFLISLERGRSTLILSSSKQEHKTLSSDEKIASRLSKVENACRHFPNRSLTDLVSSRLDHFILDETHKLIYCYVPKVACTNWKRVLLALRSQTVSPDPLSFKSNETHLHNVFVTLDQLPRKQALEKLKTYTKFMFVRNPYERLLSAYRNKFERSYSDYFLSRFGRKIIKLYRQNATSESVRKGHDVRFVEFLQYITQLDTSRDKIEFNEHWRPIVNLCYPCNVPFDVIGKYESLIYDADYTLNYVGVSHLVEFPSRDRTYNMQPSSDLLSKYYKNIPTALMIKLRQVYKEDLELFGYSLDIRY